MTTLTQKIIDRFSDKKQKYVLLQDKENKELSIKYNSIKNEPDEFWEKGDFEFSIKSFKQWENFKKEKLSLKQIKKRNNVKKVSIT